MTRPESRVLTLYGDGAGVDTIAHRCHYTRETVRDILRSYGISIRDGSRLPTHGCAGCSDGWILRMVAVHGMIGATTHYQGRRHGT